MLPTPLTACRRNFGDYLSFQVCECPARRRHVLPAEQADGSSGRLCRLGIAVGPWRTGSAADLFYDAQHSSGSRLALLLCMVWAPLCFASGPFGPVSGSGLRCAHTMPCLAAYPPPPIPQEAVTHMPHTRSYSHAWLPHNAGQHHATRQRQREPAAHSGVAAAECGARPACTTQAAVGGASSSRWGGTSYQQHSINTDSLTKTGVTLTCALLCSLLDGQPLALTSCATHALLRGCNQVQRRHRRQQESS